jgi:lysozyme
MIPQLGMDVSHWQDKINWSKAKAAGIDFAFIKATQADNIEDLKYKVNWTESRNVGMPRGAYHFYDYRVDPIKQATWLLDTTHFDSGEMGYVLDAEALKTDPPIKPPLSYPDVLRRFCEFIEGKTGKKPIIYTAYAFWTAFCPAATWARQYPLWIANYNNVAPMVPLPWGPFAWSFWQFTNKAPGAVYGVSSKQLDLNVRQTVSLSKE